MISHLISGSDERDVVKWFPNEEAFFAYLNASDSLGSELSNILGRPLQSLLALTPQYCSDLLSKNEFIGTDWNDNPKNPQPTLEDSEVDKARWIARADAPLFYNLGWSNKFAHGSDTMFPIVKVAEKLLSPWESITSITGGFDKMINHDIHIVVRDMNNVANSNIKNNNSCWNGEIHTSAWRTLKYTIHTLRTNIQDKRTHNQEACNLVSSRKETTEGLEFKIDRTKLFELHKLSGNAAYIASSLYEIATLSAFYVTRWYLNDKAEDYALTVVREIRNLWTKINLWNVDTDSTIRWRIRKSKTVWKWTYLFIELDMPFLDWKTEVVAAITHEEVRKK